MKRRIVVAIAVIALSSCVTVADRARIRKAERMHQAKILEAPSFEEACRRYEQTPRELQRAMLLQLMLVAHDKGDSASVAKVFDLQVSGACYQF